MYKPCSTGLESNQSEVTSGILVQYLILTMNLVKDVFCRTGCIESQAFHIAVITFSVLFGHVSPLTKTLGQDQTLETSSQDCQLWELNFYWVNQLLEQWEIQLWLFKFFFFTRNSLPVMIRPHIFYVQVMQTGVEPARVGSFLETFQICKLSIQSSSLRYHGVLFLANFNGLSSVIQDERFHKIIFNEKNCPTGQCEPKTLQYVSLHYPFFQNLYAGMLCCLLAEIKLSIREKCFVFYSETGTLVI